MQYGKGRKRLNEDEAFVVRHFAGEVIYETHRFLDKNNDTLHDELIAALSESQLPFVQQLFPKVVDEEPPQVSSSRERSTVIARQHGD